MVEDVEPRPLLDNRKRRHDRGAGHDELRDRNDGGNGRDDARDEEEEDNEGKEERRSS